MPTLAQRDASGTFALRDGERHEVESRRTRTAKVFRCVETPEDMVAGRHRYRIGSQIGPVHYPHDVFAERPRWREIDCEIRRAADDDDADWAMTEAGYQARFWQSRATGKAREAQALSYIGEFSRGGATYRIAPLSLAWREADGTEEAIATAVAGIDPVLDPDGYSITWPDAFGKGLDYGYNTRPDHFFKALTIRDRATLPRPGATATHLVLRLWVSWDGDGAPDSSLPAVAAEYRGGGKGAVTRHTPQTRYAHRRVDGRECFWVREPEAWDSADEPRRWPLEWWYETRGKEVVLALALPVDALETAQYPLVMDTAIDEEHVGASADDGYSTGSTYPGYASVGLVQYMVYMGRGYNIWYTSGFRFTVPLAQGMAITSAALSLRAYAARSDDIDVHWYCEDSDNSSSFSTDNMPGGTVYNNRTSATVHWELTTDVAVGTWYTTPDVSALVEEVVTRAGWSSGSGMSFIAVADAEHPNYKYLTWSSYDAGYGAKLNVTYTVPALKAYPGVAASSPAAYVAARTPGAVMSLCDIAQSTPAAYLATSGGLQSADAAWAQRTPTAWVPVRLPGAVVVLPGIAPGTATALDGSALPGVVGIAAGIAQRLAVAHAAGAVPGAVVVLPGLAQVAAQCYDLTAAPGAVTAIAALAQSVGASYVPGATPGAVVVLPSIAQGTATALNGAALPRAVVVLPGLAETVAQGYDPVAAPGAVIAIAALAQSIVDGYDVTAAPGAVVVLPGLAQSVALGYNTTAAPGVVTALAGIGLHDPAAYGAVAAGAAAIALPGRAVSQAWGYAPTALPGLVWVIADAALHVGYAYDVIMGVQMPAEGLLVIGCTGLDVDATARALLARSETELQVDNRARERMIRR